MASITDYLKKLISLKKDMVDNLNLKNVPAQYKESLTVLVPKINNIEHSIEGQIGIYPINSNGIPYGHVHFPEGVTNLIKGSIPSNQEMDKIILPKSLEQISQEAVQNCLNLISVDLGGCHNIGGRAFYQCNNLEEVIFDKSEPLNLGIECFSYTKLSDNFINDLFENNLITGTMERCFSYCTGLNNIIVNDAGYMTFYNSSVKNVIFNNKEYEKDSATYAFNSSQLESITIKNMKSIPSYFCGSCPNLTTIILSDDLIAINSQAFGSCPKLKEIFLPSALEYIGSYAFQSCSSLQRIFIPSQIKNIISGAFYKCLNLKDIYIDLKETEAPFTVPSDNWGATNATIHWQYYTINWSYTPKENTVIYFDNHLVQEETIYCAKLEQDLSYIAYNPNYLPIVGIINGQAREEKNINLEFNDTNGYRVTIMPNIEDCVITIAYDENFEHKMTTNSAIVPIGATIQYTVNKRGYSKIIETAVIDNDNTTINVEMIELQADNVTIITPFSMEAYQENYLKNLIIDNNFIINGENITNGSVSYNINSGISHGYIIINTPNYETDLEITCKVSSEQGYDFGVAYLGKQIYKPSNSDVRNQITDGDGEYIIKISGSTSFSTYTKTLSPNTKYYLNLIYTKDGSGNTGDDRFYISSIRFVSYPNIE